MKLDDFEFERWFADSGLSHRDVAYAAWSAGVKYERTGCVRLASSVWDSIATHLAKMIRLRGHQMAPARRVSLAVTVSNESRTELWNQEKSTP